MKGWIAWSWSGRSGWRKRRGHHQHHHRQSASPEKSRTVAEALGRFLYGTEAAALTAS
jgi:hypothetical protein